jgi:CheY-like chemotaxis protein
MEEPETTRKILLVEDERVTQAITRRWLLDLGYEVVVTGDGGKVMGLVEREAPDLILLDLGLDADDLFFGRGFDGFAVLEWMRRKSTVGKVPSVIVVTGRTEPGLKKRVLDAGAAAFFQKPTNKARLLTAIQVALE